MITLPEFEEERMAVMAEEHDILVDLAATATKDAVSHASQAVADAKEP